MNRFLTLILGAVLCGAAPLHAQQAFPSAPDHAAALLQKAQEAAAQGDAQRASEYARAAAEIYAAQPRGGGPAVVAAVRSRAAHEQARVAQTHAEAQAHAEAQERAAAHASERADAAAFAGEIPRLEEVFMYERAQAEGEAPPARITRWRQASPGASDAPPPMAFGMQSDPRAPGHGHAGPAPAPQAAHQDELGMTLRLIHAEVQALRAEVQALRAEMSLMRMQGRSASAAAGHGQMSPGVWTENAGQGQREVIIVTPDGERRAVIGRHGNGGVWSTAPSASRLDDFGAEAAQLEDVLEELNDLGYVDTVVAPDREEPAAPMTFRFRAGPAAGSPSAALPVPAVPATPAVPRTPRR
jgi:hypothetical protein